tara:strand:+ start:8646 stop:9266 length:621 start_codon:yes stop_codon:yes gene_type:complete
MDFEIINLLTELTASPLRFFTLSFLFLLFAGEPVVLGFAFVSLKMQLLLVWQIILLSVVAAVLAELFWFSLARNRLFQKCELGKKFPNLRNDLKILRSKSKLDNPLRLLFVSRMITGASLLVIVILSRQNLSFKKFLQYSVLVNIFWSTVIVGLGYAASLGYTILINTLGHIAHSLEIGLAVILCSYLLYRMTSRHFGTKTINKIT